MRRIFLVGCPRSGTTLVQSLLGSARGVVTFTESHFFDKCFGSLYFPFRTDADPDCVEATLRRFRQENALEGFGTELGMPADSNSAAESFIRLLDRVTAANSGVGWVEKTPDHLHKIGLIRRVAPDATFVHILRRPAETVDSLRRASREWGRPRSWYAFALKWSLSARTSGRYVRKPGHVHVFYEDIVTNTQAEIKALFERLGLEWDEGVLDRYLNTANSAIAADESWKKNNLREIEFQSEGPISHGPLQNVLLRLLETQYETVRSSAAKKPQ